MTLITDLKSKHKIHGEQTGYIQVNTSALTVCEADEGM